MPSANRYNQCMSGIEVDNANSRIWLIRYPPTFNVGDFRQLFVDVRRLNPDRYKHTVLIDFGQTDPRSATGPIRREAAEVIKEHMDFLTETTVAEARVAPNPVVRGVLTVFDWVQPKPWGINNLNSGPTAEHWLRAQLVRHGIEVPAQPVWRETPISRSA